MTRRTKIVATIGPSSQDAETLAAMMRAGMNVARIALAHTPVDEALEIHRLVRQTAQQVGRTVATLVDLPGPLIRTGLIPGEGYVLKSGDQVTLRVGTEAGDSKTVFIDNPDLIQEIVVGDHINIGESVIVRVNTIEDDHIIAEIISGGMLTGRPAVKVPSHGPARVALTADDRAALDSFLAADVDIVAISVSSGDDLADLQLTPPPNGPLLMAKIESMAAVENLDSLIGTASGIIIGRGGLGLEARLEDLPHLQKRVIQDCIAGGLPVITASQMLDSMLSAPVPTRAETTDVSNAIFDGTSGLMLSAETAVGDHPPLVVETMARIAETADDRFNHHEWGRRVTRLRMTGDDSDETKITDAMTIGAARTAEELGLDTLLCISASGFTVRSMARFRPSAQIIGVSRHERTVRQLASSWGVTPVHYSSTSSDYADKVDDAIAAALSHGLVSPGELVGVVAGITSANRATDTFRIARAPG